MGSSTPISTVTPSEGLGGAQPGRRRCGLGVPAEAPADPKPLLFNRIPFEASSFSAKVGPACGRKRAKAPKAKAPRALKPTASPEAPTAPTAPKAQRPPGPRPLSSQSQAHNRRSTQGPRRRGVSADTLGAAAAAGQPGSRPILSLSVSDAVPAAHASGRRDGILAPRRGILRWTPLAFSDWQVATGQARPHHLGRGKSRPGPGCINDLHVWRNRLHITIR